LAQAQGWVGNRREEAYWPTEFFGHNSDGFNEKARARFQRPHVDEAVLSHTATAAPGPDSQAETALRDQVMQECIQTLPEVYQSALRLYYWLGASVAEVAELLGVPENTAKSYLHRARQLLDGMLKQRGYSYV